MGAIATAWTAAETALENYIEALEADLPALQTAAADDGGDENNATAATATTALSEANETLALLQRSGTGRKLTIQDL